MLPQLPQILFEDKYLLALNKPNGMVTDKDKRIKNTLESLALDYVRSKEKYPQKCFIGLPHRLDRPVSGVVLLAKKKSVLKKLTEIFEKREIEKTYLAIVENRPANDEGELVNWLVKDAANRKAIIHASEVKNSMRVVLWYKFISQNKSGSLLEIKLITGKFHQIRAQLAYIGCPIVGDLHYGAKKIYKENAICLHARELKLVHPITGGELKVVAPMPDEALWNLFFQK